MTESNQDTNEAATVLVVDDEQGLADLYALHLEEEYTTRTAYSGKETLDTIDDDVDAVLLDRRMPGRSGDEVLTTLRERGYGQPVAMLTAVDPGEEIIELDIDEYFVKPLDDTEIRKGVEELLARKHYDEEFREYYAVISKKAALEASMSEQELASSDAYNTLEQEVTEAKDAADSALTEMMSGDVFGGFREF